MKCTKCGHEIEAGTGWEGIIDGVLCQDCFEDWTSDEYWKIYGGQSEVSCQ